MKPLFRLIRLPNLIVVAITQWMVAIPIIAWAAAENNLTTALNHNQLLLLILSTLSIVVAGYCVNDVLDYPIDIVNHPKKVVVIRRIRLRTVYWLIAFFGIFGFICALILAFQRDEIDFLWLYPFFILLLGGYPKFFKTRPFAGNLLISASCAGVAALVWLAERSTWHSMPAEAQNEIGFLLIIFMIYAFLATWIREIVKDMEDYQGDMLGGRKTFPITYGVKQAKTFIHFLAIILTVVLVVNAFYWGNLSSRLPVIALSVLLGLAIVFMQWKLISAKTPGAYHKVSSLWKYFMLGGLVLLFLY